jgi:hypothetical protein
MENLLSKFSNSQQKRKPGAPCKEFYCEYIIDNLECGESNPNNFSHNRKSICKKCYSIRSKILMKDLRKNKIKENFKEIVKDNEDLIDSDSDNENDFIINKFCDLLEIYNQKGKLSKEVITIIGNSNDVFEEIIVKLVKIRSKHKN